MGGPYVLVTLTAERGDYKEIFTQAHIQKDLTYADKTTIHETHAHTYTCPSRPISTPLSLNSQYSGGEYRILRGGVKKMMQMV